MDVKTFIFIVAALLMNSLNAFGQSKTEPFNRWLKNKEGVTLETFLMMQLWSVYSTGQELYDPEIEAYKPVEDRLNIQLRRARFGFRGQPLENLRFTFVGAYDLIGRDALSGTVGGTNNGGLPSIGVWDAFMEWRIIPKSEKLYLVSGYFRPQFSREAITSGWAVSSMEKSTSQNYVRKHLTGSGPGRTIGVNLGGILQPFGMAGLRYDLGIFTPQYLSFGGLSSGIETAPLFAARTVLEFGDLESATYKINYDLNFYNLRNGLSIAFAGAYQGKTDLFVSSYGLQADVLWNRGSFNMDAEYNWLWREGFSNVTGTTAVSRVSTGHIRSSYNLVVSRKYWLEPAAMIMFFEGAHDKAGQQQADALRQASGSERAYDVGINWHLQEKKLKLLLHYTWRTGDPGSAGDGAVVNTYFAEPGIGAIRRGNWLGLGLHGVF